MFRPDKGLPYLPEGGRQELTRLVESVIADSYKINQGNNGIILKIDPNDEQKTKLVQDLILKADTSKVDLIAKMLKLYSPGQAKREVAMQLAAYEAVDNASKLNPDTQYAQVPQVYLDETIKITDKVMQCKIEEMGVQVGDGGKVEVILMDYINGIDFATYIDRLVVANHPGLVHLREHLNIGERWNFYEMHRAVAEALQFNIPGGKSSRPYERMYEEKRVFDDNRKKIIDYLKKSDIVINKRILESVKNTINVLHGSGIYHGDLHERNIMLSFKDDHMTELDELFLVDYGRATRMDSIGENSDDEQLINDKDFLAHYSILTLSRAEEVKIEKEKKKEVWLDILERYENEKTPKDLFINLQRDIKEILNPAEGEVITGTKIISRVNDDVSTQLLAGLLLREAAQDELNKQKVLVVLDILISKLSTHTGTYKGTYICNELTKLKEILKEPVT